MQVYPYALTTLASVKARLNLQNTASDALLSQYINSATDFVERECGLTGLTSYPNDGHFMQKKYLNEVYTAKGRKQERLVLRNAPVTYLIVTGNLTQGSAVVASVTNLGGLTTALAAGMPLYAIQGLFPQGTTVVSISGTSVTMSQPASTSQAGATFELSGLISFQWRSGTPSNPNWTDFIQDQFELDQMGRSGIIRVYGSIPGLYNNMIRATYVAGYPINFGSAGDGATHQLPADLTNLCENLVVRIFKRLPLAGKASEGIQGAQTSWRDKLDAFDLNVIANYRRVANIF